MRYLVTMETIDSGEILGPAENAALLEDVVIPSLQTFSEWEKAGTIRGGLLAGRRGVAFIVDADSNEALSDMLGSLPVWGTAEVEVTPLESIDHRLNSLKAIAQQMRG